jgi:hypothetical protein
MTTHTPGPWTFVESSDARIPDRITSTTGAPVASGSIGVNRSDAALIAAAPDLLAALQAIVAEAGPRMGLDDTPGTINTMSRLARAAIARATHPL